MRRGDVVTVAATGDYGKPRPAVIVRTDALPAGLRVRSQVMADKPVTIRRERIGQPIGELDHTDIARLNIALAFVMGLAD
jgi:mRNA interferase MazF